MYKLFCSSAGCSSVQLNLNIYVWGRESILRLYIFCLSLNFLWPVTDKTMNRKFIFKTLYFQITLYQTFCFISVIIPYFLCNFRIFIGIKKLLALIDLARQTEEQYRVIKFLSRLEEEGGMEPLGGFNQVVHMFLL